VALEDVEAACTQAKGLISSSPESLKGLVDLMRGLKARLGDLQSNLKPIAARNIASILNSVDSSSQAKLGKVVYASLIQAGINDNKKVVRDAALEALDRGTNIADIDGGGVNPKAMEPLIAGFVSASEESEYKVSASIWA
jgi:hypothetical protein